MQEKVPANQLAEIWLKLIDEVIEDTRYSDLVTISEFPVMFSFLEL